MVECCEYVPLLTQMFSVCNVSGLCWALGSVDFHCLVCGEKD